jgi:hypothetical protein
MLFGYEYELLQAQFLKKPVPPTRAGLSYLGQSNRPADISRNFDYELSTLGYAEDAGSIAEEVQRHRLEGNYLPSWMRSIGKLL